MQNHEIANDNLKRLEPIFIEWQRLLRVASENSGGNDSPYIHNEQGNNHLFACACSHANYTAMQEVVGRSKDVAMSTRRAVMRRLDICFFDSKSRYAAEAKWIEFDGDNPPYNKIPQTLQAALDDVENYQNPWSELFSTLSSRIGLLYVVPHFSRDASDSDLMSLIKGVLSECGANAYAYSFLKKDRSLQYHVEGRFYPGVLVLAKTLS